MNNIRQTISRIGKDYFLVVFAIFLCISLIILYDWFFPAIYSETRETLTFFDIFLVSFLMALFYAIIFMIPFMITSLVFEKSVINVKENKILLLISVIPLVCQIVLPHQALIDWTILGIDSFFATFIDATFIYVLLLIAFFALTRWRVRPRPTLP